MSSLTYEEKIKRAYQGLIILGVVTLAEVFMSLLANGYIIEGLEQYAWAFYLGGLIIIILSLYKAYFIISEFMHMRYEVKDFVLSVLLPTSLLIWLIIAFLWGGDTWGNRRDKAEMDQIENVGDFPTGATSVNSAKLPEDGSTHSE